MSGALGCARAPVSPLEAPATPAASVEPNAGPPGLLDEPAARAARAGASPLELLGTAASVAGDSVSGLVNVPAGRCALLLARGTSGIEDIDLIVFAEDGSELGADESPDDEPHVVVCPERSIRLFASARVIQGRGIVSLGVQDLAPAAREQVLWALGVARSTSEELAQGWPGLERALSEHRSALGGTWLDLRRVAVPVDARVPTRVSAEIPADRCVDALLLPSDEVGRLDLEAVDESGRIFARAGGRSSSRSLLLCGGTEKTAISFEVRPESGRGLALLVLSTSRAAKEELALKSGTRSVDAAPRRTPALSKTTSLRRERLLLEVGAIQSLSFDQEGCARLTLVPEEPLYGVDAKLWSPGGSLLGGLETTTSASLFFCAATPGTRLELIATRRAGPLRVELQEQWTPPRVLLDHPLAASRLLALADHVGLSPRLPAPRVSEGSAERFLQEDLEIPAGRCLISLVALDRGAWGAEVRLLDRKTGLELGSGRGADGASARVCAPTSGPLAVQLRLRPVQGKTTILSTKVLEEAVPTNLSEPRGAQD